MRGSSKILMVLVVVMILAAPFARADDGLGLPTDKTSGATYELVRFDGVVYRITADVECELFFFRIDNEHHLLSIKPVEEGPTPLCVVVVQWGMFAPVALGLGAGDTNDWILGTETGYAEK
ncbi:MAG: hypothetical protein KAU49_00245 [Candidatus Krumholzibacteria bacterium]|nr:hypothetical protein [Candidatus Krumholzibacteria bacterium]